MTDPDASISSNATALDVDSSITIGVLSKPLETADRNPAGHRFSTSDTTNTATSPTSSLPYQPASTSKPDTATVNNQKYAITDANRTEIMRDLLSLDHASFATKWQAVHRGPNPRMTGTPEVARGKGGRGGIE